MHTLGIDYGTNPVRALVVRCADGAELGTCVVNYSSGKQGILLDPRDHPGVLVNRHAPFTWGETVAQAVEVAVAAECCAHLALMSLALDPQLKAIEPELLNKHFKRKHGPDAYYGQK
ncbi:class II aldolase/adducin family protein [Opitutus sp. GAS368]|uniref:class II aldolase/adducin family protein n=1 Tax=Opitutus sp. GAS368 TaxID=1882749 RepID=UPI000A7A7DD2|nr:class II aldolase/adducin family protein [Opitutus sp. GAS368]